MSKKMPIIFTVLIAIIALFTATRALAQPPLSCSTPGDLYTLRPEDPGNFPFYNTTENRYEWIWVMTTTDPKALGKITQVHLYIPSLPPYNQKILGPSGVHVSQRAEGGNGSGSEHGANIFNGIVVTIAPVAGANEDEKRIILYTASGGAGVISPLFDGGRFLEPCVAQEYDSLGNLGGIVGPGSQPSDQIPAEEDRFVNLANGLGNVRIKTHPVSGCFLKFSYWDEDLGDWVDLVPSPPGWLQAGKATVDFGSFDDRFCRQGIITIKGSPVQYWGYANGDYTCIGEWDPDVPSWTQPCP